MSNNLTLYVQATEVVRDFLLGKASLKNLLYADHIVHRKATIALVHQTLKYRPLLCELLKYAQVPGFRVDEIARYDAELQNALRVETKEVRELMTDSDGPRTERKTLAQDVADDEDENDGRVIAPTWYSCTISIDLDEYERPGKKGKPRQPERNKGNHDSGSSEPPSKKQPDYKYSREAMLVATYDLLIGSGLPRFHDVSAGVKASHDREGIVDAVRFLARTPAIPYRDDLAPLAYAKVQYEKAKSKKGALPHPPKERVLDRYVNVPNAPLKQRLKMCVLILQQALRPKATNQKEDQPFDFEVLLPAPLRGLGTRKTPRYVRVNTLKTTLDKVKARLREEGYVELKGNDIPTKATGFLPVNALDNSQSVKSSNHKTHKQALVYWQDSFIPNLLCFTPTDLNILQSPMIELCELIVQDKASCFTPHAVQPVPNDGDVIDTCAAPGNKTTLLAGLMQNTGTLFAVERNARRAQLLKNRVEACGATNTQVLLTSFLELDPMDERFANVRYIMLDPSCSGSGNPSLDLLLATGGKLHDPESLHVRSLSDLQFQLVSHAFKFPNVQKVVYSTCSVFTRENEGVVARLLMHINAHHEGQFVLESALPAWKRRGFSTFPRAHLASEPASKFTDASLPIPQAPLRVSTTDSTQVDFSDFAPLCARVHPDEDSTGGFFVAVFKRVQQNEVRETSNSTYEGRDASKTTAGAVQIGEKRGNSKDQPLGKKMAQR